MEFFRQTAFILLSVVICPLAIAQTEQRFLGSDTQEGDFFGYDLSISGGTLVVSGLRHNFGLPMQGAAYVFERGNGVDDTWIETRKLTNPPSLSFYSFFGSAVSIDGNNVLVRSSTDNELDGAAVLFNRNQGGADQWGHVAILEPSDGQHRDRFGWDVATMGDIAVVSSPGADDQGLDSGSVYIFYRNQGGPDMWGEFKKILASDGESDDFFGRKTEIQDDLLLVSSNQADDSGAVYVFDRHYQGTDTWGEVAKIKASDSAAGDFFGASIASDGEVILVGAPAANTSTGAAYVFARHEGGADAWGEIKRLTSPGQQPHHRFGDSVAMNNRIAAVGASSDVEAVYLFGRNHGGVDAWGQVATMTPSNGAPFQEFGSALAFEDGALVVGAFGDNNYTGATYGYSGGVLDVIFAGNFDSGQPSR